MINFIIEIIRSVKALIAKNVFYGLLILKMNTYNPMTNNDGELDVFPAHDILWTYVL